VNGTSSRFRKFQNRKNLLKEELKDQIKAACLLLHRAYKIRKREKITIENSIRIIRNLLENKQKNKPTQEEHRLKQMLEEDTVEVIVHQNMIMMIMMPRKLSQRVKTEKDQRKSRSKKSRKKDNRAKFPDYSLMN
jgi:hypothetical protein